MTNKRIIAKEMYDHYDKQRKQLMKAQERLTASDGVKSYTIGDRQLTRYNLEDIAKEIENCLEKMEEYDRILRGKSGRKKGNVIPTDL